MSNIDKREIHNQQLKVFITGFLTDPAHDNQSSRSLTAEVFRIALASLEAEPVAEVCEGFTLRYIGHGPAPKSGVHIGDRLYTAPPAPVSVPDAYVRDGRGRMMLNGRQEPRIGYSAGWNACRAAMLQGADSELQRKAAIHDALCEKYSVESLADFVDWQRNHITELEAAPPAPVGQGEPAVMPDYPGYVMTQRECFQAGAKRAVPDGWVAVPIEPTEDMIVNGFESEPDESFSDEKEWEEYEAMSGCQQAAHRAKLCWAAMLAAAPRPEA